MHRLQPRPRLARRMRLDHDAPPIGQPDAGYHTDVGDPEQQLGNG